MGVGKTHVFRVMGFVGMVCTWFGIPHANPYLCHGITVCYGVSSSGFPVQGKINYYIENLQKRNIFTNGINLGWQPCISRWKLRQCASFTCVEIMWQGHVLKVFKNPLLVPLCSLFQHHLWCRKSGIFSPLSSLLLDGDLNKIIRFLFLPMASHGHWLYFWLRLTSDISDSDIWNTWTQVIGWHSTWAEANVWTPLNLSNIQFGSAVHSLVTSPNHCAFVTWTVHLEYEGGDAFFSPWCSFKFPKAPYFIKNLDAH